MKKILAIIGARPQFIKHAPLEKELKKEFEIFSIHTGQHYDNEMSNVFFNELGINRPLYNLEVGSHSHGIQTGKMMIELEEIILKEKPDAVLVYGDTNSTLAGALVAAKMNVPVIHIEAGLRSFNKEMPEELNRIITDHISEILFVPTQKAVTNLENEGITKNVFLVGDVMCDILLWVVENVNFDTPENGFYYATIHRPYNTDNPDRLLSILTEFNKLGLKVVFSLHPRTRELLKKAGLKVNHFSNIEFIKPASYIENVKYLKQCSALLTDSGGMQKEAYILKKKCITLRSETEWEETLEGNWNSLVFNNLSEIGTKLKIIPDKHNSTIYGTGKASSEICNILCSLIK